VGGSGNTLLKCHWTGSEAGILTVASNAVVTDTFLSDSACNGADHGTNDPANTTGATISTTGVQLCMADNAQSYSRTKTPAISKAAEVGVITFRWVRNPGLMTSNNVTDNMIRQALKGGCVRSVFTGVAGQTNDYVYVSGRDNLSGTRVNAFADCGFGITTKPNQIEMNSSGVMQTLDANGDYVGDYGYSSGGTLAGTLGANTTSANDPQNGLTVNGGYSVIAYLSYGDSATAIQNGATELAYNGVYFSSQAVKEGNYNFWGNEYVMEANNAGATAAEADKIYNALAATTGINAYCDGTKAIKLTDMNCTRGGPTADPAHN